MKDGVTMLRQISLAGRIFKMIPAISQTARFHDSLECLSNVCCSPGKVFPKTWVVNLYVKDSLIVHYHILYHLNDIHVCSGIDNITTSMSVIFDRCHHSLVALTILCHEWTWHSTSKRRFDDLMIKVFTRTDEQHFWTLFGFKICNFQQYFLNNYQIRQISVPTEHSISYFNLGLEGGSAIGMANMENYREIWWCMIWAK